MSKNSAWLRQIKVPLSIGSYLICSKPRLGTRTGLQARDWAHYSFSFSRLQFLRRLKNYGLSQFHCFKWDCLAAANYYWRVLDRRLSLMFWDLNPSFIHFDDGQPSPLKLYFWIKIICIIIKLHVDTMSELFPIRVSWHKLAKIVRFSIFLSPSCPMRENGTFRKSWD